MSGKHPKQVNLKTLQAKKQNHVGIKHMLFKKKWMVVFAVKIEKKYHSVLGHQTNKNYVVSATGCLQRATDNTERTQIYEIQRHASLNIHSKNNKPRLKLAYGI